MRDIPGLAWIFGFFFVFVISVFVYSKSGPQPIQPAQNVWSYVEYLAKQIDTRKITLAQGQVHQEPLAAYTIRLERLKDEPLAKKASCYMANLRPAFPLPAQKTFLQNGMDVGFVDEKPDEAIGSVRVVTFRTIESAP